MSFKVSSRFAQAAEVANLIPTDKFPVLLSRVLQKLHIKGERLFSEEEEEQLRAMFTLSADDLHLLLDALCYCFEQAAFTSTGPEALLEVVLGGGFDEAHGKLVGRAWAGEAAEYVSKLKDQKLGFRSLSNIDYHLNMVMGQSELFRQQEPVAIFELQIDEAAQHKSAAVQPSKSEKVTVEFDHGELYSFFTQLERIQQQLDSLGK